MFYRAALALFVLLLPAEVWGQAPQRGIYIIMQGETEIAREKYEFTGRRLVGTLDVTVQGISLEFTAAYDSSLAPLTYHADVRTGGGAEPVQRIDVSFTGTAAEWSVRAKSGDTSGSTPLTQPYSFLQNLVFSQLAVHLLRYDRDVGGGQVWSAWVPEGNGVVSLEVEFSSPTEARVKAARVEMNVSMDQDGWLRRVDIPVQGVTVFWQSDDGADPPGAGPGGQEKNVRSPVRSQLAGFSQVDMLEGRCRFVGIDVEKNPDAAW